MTAETDVRILDATLELLAEGGLRGLALEEVASAAGVSRQTVYRHFGNRDGLLGAVIVREEEALLGVMMRAVDAEPDLGTAVRNGVAAALAAADAHPLLHRLLETEPDALLPFLTLGSGPVLSVIGPAIAEVVRRRVPGLPEDRLEFLADVVGRVVVSLAVAPRGDRDDTAARLAELVVAYVTADGGPVAA